MGLTLHIQGSGAVPGGAGSTVLNDGALTIGRADGNDLILPDPDRGISSRHCVIEERGNDFVVLDISTNGTFLNYNGQPLGPTPTPLNHGDTLMVGPFELRIEITAGLGAPPVDPYANLAAPMASEPLMPMAPAPADGFVGGLDDPSQGGGGGDYLNDLLGSGPAQGPDASALGAPAPDPAPLIPDDEDMFGGPKEDIFDGEPVSGQNHASSSNDFFSAPELIPSGPTFTSGGGGGDNMIPDDWDMDEDLSAPVAPPPVADVERSIPPEPASEAVAAKVPVEPSPVSKITEPLAAEPQKIAPSGPVSGDAARAFLAAADASDVDIPDDDLVSAMERSGAAYRILVEGLREVLMTRASIKSEFRLGQTMISPDGNNPIKFSISGDQAVEAMLKPNMPGYLDAARAAKEAVDDVKAHEVAMMTGMQAAIKNLLKKFDPAALSERIESKKGLFGGKKAKKWDVFEKMYSEIALEAEDDFQALFGKAFSKAYEDQLRKLR
ncbi:MAG: type VI secretion system-associated FHA domain protein TagH [Rhodobacteraceae bacterium]|nr:type VI secretion system-associated FHA domain protein TagH [Paracoccaceae bacterium]